MCWSTTPSASASKLISVKGTDIVSSLNLPHSGSKDFIETIKTLKIKYDEEIEKIRKSADQRKNDAKSGECFYNGKLKKEIRGNYESYYICRCESGFLGDNCQISKALYDSTQLKLMSYLEEIEKQFVNSSHHNRKKFLTSLIMINKFRIGRPIIERMVSIVENYLHKDRELDNRKKLYVFYDAILLNLFDSLEDMRKSTFEVYNTDTNLQLEKNETYNLIHHVIEMLENSLEDHVYLNSFLDKKAPHYISLDTYSFVIGEQKLKKFELPKGFPVHNPNIDTSFNVVQSNRIYFDFESKFDHKKSKHNIQMLTIAAPLFDDKLRNYGDIPVSNILYLKYVNPKNTHETILHRDNQVRNLKVDFALTFIPAYDDILGSVNCMAYFFGVDKSNIPGKAVSLDEDKMVVSCEFPTYFEFKNYYFAVSMKK